MPVFLIFSREMNKDVPVEDELRQRRELAAFYAHLKQTSKEFDIWTEPDDRKAEKKFHRMEKARLAKLAKTWKPIDQFDVCFIFYCSNLLRGMENEIRSMKQTITGKLFLRHLPKSSFTLFCIATLSF